MPKILRILNRFNLGGPVYNAAYLSRYLDPEFETLLIGGPCEASEACAQDIIRSLGIDPIVIPEMGRAIRPIQDIKTYKKIAQIIEDFRPDIVHTHASKAGAIGRIAAIKKRVKVIVHTFHGHVFHSYFNSLKTNIFINLERQLARHTSQVIAISDTQKKELSQMFRIGTPEKFTVIPLGFDLSRFRENRLEKRKEFRAKYNLCKEDIAIGIIGRLARVKNHTLFLKAVAKVQNRSTKNIRVFIIGDGELKRDLIKTCQDNHLDHCVARKDRTATATVTFTSWIKQIDTVYPGLDIVAMTSLNEGTPVCLIEAQASGVPIVATNVGGVEDIVIPFETALLTKSKDSIDFSEKLLRLVEDQQLRGRLAQQGWQHVQNKFHYVRLVADTERLYRELLSQNM